MWEVHHYSKPSVETYFLIPSATHYDPQGQPEQRMNTDYEESMKCQKYMQILVNSDTCFSGILPNKRAL